MTALPCLRAAFGLGALLLACSSHAQVVSSDSNVAPATARKQALEVANGGPARWNIEDKTVAARLRTLRKEIAAGLQENLGNCTSMPSSERSACAREARAIYREEMAGARARATIDPN